MEKICGRCPCYCQGGLSRPTEEPSQPSRHNREHKVHTWVGRCQFYPFPGYKNCEESNPDGSIKLLVYRKKSHTGQYLHLSSHHPLHQKLGVYHTLMDRAHGIITESEDVQTEEDHIKSSLRKCGYPDWSFRQIDQQMSRRSKTKPKPSQKKGMVTIPYVKGTSEALQRIFNKYNVATTMRPLSKLRSMLVHPKDKRSLEDSTGVVYQIPCKDCDKVYVGETGRKFGVRKTEHKQEAETFQKAHFTRSKKKEAETAINKSAISDHVAQENQYHWMEKEQDSFQRQQQIY